MATFSKRAVLGLAVVLTASFTHAEDWTTTDGKTYKDIKVKSQDDSGVTILYADGGGVIPWSKLPIDIQKKNGHDPDKIAADLKAQQDAQAAAQKAQQDKQAAAQAARDKKELEAEQQQDGINKKAKSDYDSMEKAAVTGQVFIVTKGGDNIKLGLIHVYLYSEDQAHAALEVLAMHAESETKKLQTTLDAEKANCIKLHAALDSTAGTLDADAPLQKYNDACEEYRKTLVSYYVYSSQSYYGDSLPSPVADSVSDADGKFTMQIPKTGSWVLGAQGKRTVGDDTEEYLWITKIGSDAIAKNQVFLNNENLTGNDSLMTGLSSSDIAFMIKDKVDNVLKKDDN